MCGGFRGFERCVDFRLQFVSFRLFTEDLRQRVDTLFGTFFKVGGIGGHLDGRRNGVQLVKRFGCAAADDDELRFVGVERFIIRLEQRTGRFRCFVIFVQIRQPVFIDGQAGFYAQFV